MPRTQESPLATPLAEIPAAAPRRATSEARQALKQAGLPRAWFTPRDSYGWWITLRILVPFLAAFALAPVLVAVSPWLALPLILVMGVYGYKISFIMHDCSHNALFRSVALNTWVGRATGWLVGTNYDVFKLTHALHHRFNGQAADPQQGETEGFGAASRGTLMRHLFLPLFGVRALSVITGYAGGYLKDAMAAAPALADVGRRSRPVWLAGTALAQLGLLALVTGGFTVLWTALLYPIAAVTLALFLARFRTVAEHIAPPGPNYTDFIRTHHPNWFDAVFLYDAHFNYHVEHHLFPSLPSCYLPQLFAKHGALIHTDRTLSDSMIRTIRRRLREATV